MPNIYLITGATSDVGALLIRRLLQGDETALVAAQGCGDLHFLADVCAEHKGRVRTFDADLSDPAALQPLLDTVDNVVGAPTHFIHLPALRVVNTKFKKFDSGRFALDMRVQVESAVGVCRRLLPAMAKAGRGRVLFMLTSYIFSAPPKYAAAYVMAKEALHGLAKSLAIEYAGTGVTVNCIAPSMMETKFLEGLSDLVVEAAAEANPMGRNARPSDVVPAMEFLLSDDAAFITGITLPITGGSVML